MNTLLENKFLQAINICQSLTEWKSKPTDLTFQAIKLFCEVAQSPSNFLRLAKKYSQETQLASQAVYEYATTVDNWRVDCELGWGVKDHCTILNFFLNIDTHKFHYFTGNFTSAEQINQLLQDWKQIDLTIVDCLPSGTRLLAPINRWKVPKDLQQYVLNFPSDDHLSSLAKKAPLDEFVELVLIEDLKLDLQKRELGAFKDCKCFIPALKKYGKSVNHTYTLISKFFDPEGASVGGNIYKKVSFRDPEDNKWKLLDYLRKKYNASHKNINHFTNRLNNIDKFDDLSKLIDWLNLAKNGAKILQQLTELNKQNVDPLENLNSLVGITNLKNVLKIWENNKENRLESFWQETFKNNSFVLSLVFNNPVCLLEDQAYVGGKNLKNKNGNVVDFLYMNSITKNVALIDIKTPTEKLLSTKYRNSSYNVSSEVTGSVTQILSYKKSLLQEYTTLEKNSDNHFEVFNPDCIIVIGNYHDEIEDNSIKKETFENYRTEQKTVKIITYDELFAKIKMLIDLLEGKDTK